jgi:hypothetical protein
MHTSAWATHLVVLKGRPCRGISAFKSAGSNISSTRINRALQQCKSLDKSPTSEELKMTRKAPTERRETLQER